MQWIGTWRNQYGSTLRITDDTGHRISGFFTTALPDSGFFGETVPVVGVHQGDCVSFTFARGGPAGDTICSFTGLVREGKIQTLWHVVSDSTPRARDANGPARLEKSGWAHAAHTNADTFERVE
jgi:hypothetical protein